ncbi:MAG: hypothetical protein ACT4QC_15205 [Planctomycetaceae bacterium]
MPILSVKLRDLPIILALTAVGLACYAGQSRLNPANEYPTPDPKLVASVMEIQNRHTERLMRIPGVIGTGTALTKKGDVVINLYTFGPERSLAPRQIDGVPVRVIELWEFAPLAGRPDRQKFEARPVPIGVSAGVSPGQCGTGTLGARLLGPDGNLYALSTNHVFADENRAPTQSVIVQPAPGDSSCHPNLTTDAIGRLFLFPNIVFSRNASNRMDAAVITTTAEQIGFATPADGYGAPESTTVPAYLGQRVQKYGRTTGLTQGIVTALNVTALVHYREGTARFVEQIEVSGGDDPFGEPGDSGALVVDHGRFPVGLLFARGRRGLALVNPIDPVLSAFKMSINGSNPPKPHKCDCPGGSCPGCDPEDFGYDASISEPITASPPDVQLLPVKQLPPRCTVNMKYVPPIGGPQKTPNCFVWGSTYDLATFTAAKKGDYRPTSPELQASSAYLYIGQMLQNKLAADCCTGGSNAACLTALQRTSTNQGGTPSMLQAPYFPDCCTLWTEYGSQSLQPDPRFSIGGFKAVSAKIPNLGDVKQILYSGRALVYGTHLYTDFGTYDGTPVPYVGNGIYNKKPNGQKRGHCMLIIGYDDTLGASPN